MRLEIVREALLAEAGGSWEVAVDTQEMLVLLLTDAHSAIRTNVVAAPVPPPEGDDFRVPSTALLLGSEPPAGAVLGHQLVIDAGDGLELTQELLWLGDARECVRIVSTSVTEGHSRAADLMECARGLALTAQRAELS